jgi:hypothetical protein
LERAAADRGRQVVVFNLASPGATLPQYESMMRRCVSTYGARTIIAVIYLGNDLVELSHWIDYGEPRGDPSSPAATPVDGIKKQLRRSFLFDAAAFVWNHVDRRRLRETHTEDHLQAFYQQELYAAHPSRESSDLAVFDRELQRMRRAAAESGTRFVIAALPSWLQSDGAADGSGRATFEVALERRIADRIARSGPGYIDLAPALAAAPSAPNYWLADKHLSTHGHALAAAAIFQQTF